MPSSNVLRGARVMGEPVPIHAPAGSRSVLESATGEPFVHTAAELKTTHEEAHARGVAEGEARGVEREREHLRGLARSLESIAGALSAERTELLQQARQDLVRLAVTMAEKLARRALELDSEGALTAVQEALRRAGNGQQCVVRIHPDEAEALRRYARESGEGLFDQDHLELRCDPSIEVGGCIVETAEMLFDATVSGHLDRFAEALKDWHDQEALEEPSGESEREEDRHAA